jgi:hypothetical protein
MIVIPDIPGEQDRGPCGRVRDRGTQGLGVDPPLAHTDVPDL